MSQHVAARQLPFRPWMLSCGLPTATCSPKKPTACPGTRRSPGGENSCTGAAASLVKCSAGHLWCAGCFLITILQWAGSQTVAKPQQLLCGMPHIVGLKSLNQMDPFFPPKILFWKVVT